jgi:uncharacterized protein (TIGR02996 family)
MDGIAQAIAARDWERAMELVAEQWRATRAPSLAALAERIEAAHPTTYGQALAAVVDRQSAKTVERLRPLLCDDPRLASYVLRSLARPPFVGESSEPYWALLGEAATMARDPRVVDGRDRFTATLITQVRGWQARQRALEWLNALSRPAVRPPGLDADAFLPVTDPEAAHLTAIHSDPDDDRPRHVYADWLLERGDSRGEFIALQLGARAADAAREAQLLRKHRRAWAGQIAVCTRSERVTFRRGFVAEAYLPADLSDRRIAAAADDPAWATVERLWNFFAPIEPLLARAPLGALRDMEPGFDRRRLALVAARPLPRLSWANLLLDRDDLRDLPPLDGMPALRKVRATFASVRASEVRKVLAHLSSRGLDEVRLEPQYQTPEGAFDAVAAELEGAAGTVPTVIVNRTRLRLEAGGYYLRAPDPG